MRAAARKHIRRIFSYIRRTGSTSRSASQCAEAAASGSRWSCRGDGRSSAADAAVKVGAAKPVPTARTLGGKSKRSYYAAICEKESHYTGKRPPAEHPPPGTSRAASPRMLLHPIGQEARTFPLGPPGHSAFKRARRGKMEQTSAWQTARRRRRSLPSAVRRMTLQKQSKNATLPHKKPCKNRPSAANPAGKAGVPKLTGRFCGPRPRPPPPEPPSGRGGICPTAPFFGEKCLTRKLVCANLQSVVR